MTATSPIAHPFGWLMDYGTAEPIRPATEDEQAESRAKIDPEHEGAGVIVVDGRSCYVED